MAAGQLRWTLADTPQPQATLFDDPIFEREPGRGESAAWSSSMSVPNGSSTG